MSRTVLRHVVPVDDQWHRIDSAEHIVHVAARVPHLVEFWATPAVAVRRVDTGDCEFISATYTAAAPTGKAWEYRVFGTGHPIEDGLYVGTALAADGALVWHLFRREVKP